MLRETAQVDFGDDIAKWEVWVAKKYAHLFDKWQAFLRCCEADVAACGVPYYVLASRQRFEMFLDHGFDQCGEMDRISVRGR
jgi:hypothetical protein